MAKLYKAIDKIDGEMTAFIVRDDGKVCKSTWSKSDALEIAMAKASFMRQFPSSRGMKDAINPILMAEW